MILRRIVLNICCKKKQGFLYRFIISGLLLQLIACSPVGKLPTTTINVTEYRQQAAQSIYENRYADGIKWLRKVIKLDPTGSDYLLLGDLQEALERFRPARSSYQKGLEYAATPALQQKLNFQLATLEALEFNHLDKTAKLAALLPESSVGTLNLQALLALRQHQYDRALRFARQVVNNSQDQEMTGWAHFHAAQTWTAVGNDTKAFRALFMAINHARGRGLVARITRLWEELKQRPLGP